MIIEQFKAIAQPIVEGFGLRYWGAEYLSGESLLRLYIDAEQGVNVDDCANVSREVSVALDVEDLIVSQYRLEVSSPGMRRQFFALEQFAEFVGYTVKLKLQYAFEGRRNFKGIVSSVDVEQNELGLILDEEEYLLPYEQVERAVLVPDFNAEPEVKSGEAQKD